jgi:phosphatidylinositol alpha-mannosyltransferase
MKIAITHRFSWPEVRRGAERMVPALASALAERGHDVTVFTAGSHAERRRDDGILTVRIRQHYESPRHDIDFALRILPRLVGGRFDAVHSFGPWDAAASVCAAAVHRGRRTLYTDLGVPLQDWLRDRPERRPSEFVVRRIDYYGCMSQYALDELRDQYGREGVLTPGGVDLDEFRPADSRSPHPVLLFSGALNEPRKGLAMLLEALPLVARQEPGVRLWLSGPGDPADVLAAAQSGARDRTDVLGVGEAGAQAERYGRAWATALPSKWDSFGMALLESLACGTPLVATTHGAPKELISDGTGALCEPDDAAGLADACLRALALARDPGTTQRCRDAARPYEWRGGLAPAFERLYDGTAPGARRRGRVR